MRSGLFLAAVAAIALPVNAYAAETIVRPGMRSAQARAPKPHSVILSVTENGTTQAAPEASASKQAGTPRLVYIDGVLVEMSEEFIRGQIAAGTFTVVYPGTTIPWNPSEDRHPNYPPDWF